MSTNNQANTPGLEHKSVENRIPRNNAPPVTGSNPPESQGIQPFDGIDNPIFNFRPDFINRLNAISPLDLSTAVPFIGMRLLNPEGVVIQNLNLSLFSKPVDLNNIYASVGRYPERPEVSLKSVDIVTDNASGYFYYERIKVNLKLHKPSDIVNKSLVALLVPGMIIELEYGWNSNSTTIDALTKHQILNFNVTNYTMNFDVTGQADLLIEGMSFSDKITSLIIGDGLFDIPPGELNKAKDLQGPGGKQLVDKISLDGLGNAKEQLDKVLEYINTAQSANQEIAPNSVNIIKSLTKAFPTIDKKIKGQVDDNFKSYYDALAATKQPSNEFRQQKKVKSDGSVTSAEYVTVHNVIKNFVDPTLNAFKNNIFGGAIFRIAYGHFNENCGNRYRNKCIGDFRIRWTDLDNYIKKSRGNDKIFTIRSLLEFIVKEYINNDDTWNKYFQAGESNVVPQVVYHITSFKEGDNRIVQLSLTDINKDIPPTTSSLQENTNISSDQMQNGLVGTSIPVIRIGHVNSVIKSISMSNFDDPNIKAFLIAKAYKSKDVSFRIPLVKSQESVDTTNPSPPLFLPLKGEMTVLGNPEWKPFRFFYLDTGIFFMNGMYKILSVTHTLSAEGYNTKVTFMYH